MTKTLKIQKPREFSEATKACAAVKEIYDAQVAFLCAEFDAFSKGKIPKEKVRGFYPYIKIEVTESSYKKLTSDEKYAYGFV